jgi:acetylglutamate/LysW-gamma-L-alpha-aminoadipate kinase
MSRFILQVLTDQPIMVHGGGKNVTQIASEMGKEQQFLVSPEGFRSRYTDRDTMEIFTMVMAGKINKRIVSSFLAHGIHAVGITGIDGASVGIDHRWRPRQKARPSYSARTCAGWQAGA